MTKVKFILPAPTPTLQNAEDNQRAIDSYVKFAANMGFHGFFVLGTWGGFTFLDFEKRLQIYRAFASSANSQNKEVICHVGDQNPDVSFRLAEALRNQNINGIASTIPFYYSGPKFGNFLNIKAYFEDLLSVTDHPIIIYNNPRTTGHELSPSEVGELFDLGVSGIKDGSKSPDWLIEAKYLGLDMQKIFPGNTVQIPLGLMAGSRTFISGTSIFFKNLLIDEIQNYEKTGSFDFLTFGMLMKFQHGIERSGFKAPSLVYNFLSVNGIPFGQAPKFWNRCTDQEFKNLTDDYL